MAYDAYSNQPPYRDEDVALFRERMLGISERLTDSQLMVLCDALNTVVRRRRGGPDAYGDLHRVDVRL